MSTATTNGTKPRSPRKNAGAYFSTGQAARHLRCSVSKVVRMIRDGELEHYILPHTKEQRIPRESLMQLMGKLGLTMLESGPETVRHKESPSGLGEVVFTTGQIAAHLHCAARTVSKIIDRGDLEAYRLPGSQDRRVPRESLIRFLKEHNLPLGDLGKEGDAPPPLLARILLVGTPPDLVKQVRAILPDAPLATNAFEAGALVAKHRPEIVVIDFALGRAEAMRMVQHVRALLPACRVVALANEDEKTMRAAGFDRVCRKPVGVGELFE